MKITKSIKNKEVTLKLNYAELDVLVVALNKINQDSNNQLTFMTESSGNPSVGLLYKFIKSSYILKDLREFRKELCTKDKDHNLCVSVELHNFVRDNRQFYEEFLKEILKDIRGGDYNA